LQVDVANERHLIAHDPVATPVNGVAAQTLSQAKDFHWNGTLGQGETLEVRSVYGSIRTIASTNGSIQLNARIHDSARVRVDVVHRDNGITICTVASTPNGDESECQPAKGRPSAQTIEDRVDFVIQVPAGVRFAASMIHGDIIVNSPRSDVHVATIDGDIALDVSPDQGAEFYGNSVSGAIDSDFRVYDTAPPLPPGAPVDRHRPQIVRATIGNGGPALVASTINGNIRLRTVEQRAPSEPKPED